MSSEFPPNKDNGAVFNSTNAIYVFPSFSYHIYKENEEVEKHDVETESELDELILKHNKIIITGEQKAGKTVLARKLFRIFLEKGKTPLLISASDINKKRIEKTIEYTFAEQYDREHIIIIYFLFIII